MGTGFIIGGEQTKRGELSYLAALGYRQKTGRIEYNCGGTLINRYMKHVCNANSNFLVDSFILHTAPKKDTPAYIASPL